MEWDKCKKCGGKLIPNIRDLNGMICISCRQTYVAGWNKNESLAGVG